PTPAPAPTPAPTPDVAPPAAPAAPPVADNDAFLIDETDFDIPPAPVVAPPPAIVQPAPVMPAPAPAALVVPTPPAADAAAAITEACYEFAFQGYNLSGKPAGWIRAERGRYLFHPFSDTDCSAPTGEYNYATGMITDLKDPGRVIGSDSEHIGIRALGTMAAVPTLTSPLPTRTVHRAQQLDDDQLTPAAGGSASIWGDKGKPKPPSSLLPSSYKGGEATVSSVPYDRTFVLRQFKPIPATIVSEVRADTKNAESRLPVQATVDRNVYSDNGRTIIIPTGTLMLGFITGELPGPYKAIGRMQINWYRFVRPDGVEFNFTGGKNPFSADSQGRVGVPGHGSTDYIQSMVMPMLTALVPAAVNLIAPISDRFVNQINLDNNTVTQSGQVRSSELAKQQIISTWNNVVQKLAIDMLDNTVPPFSIAAGTRITVFSPTDLIVTCASDKDSKEKCAITDPMTDYASYQPGSVTMTTNKEELVGQVHAFTMASFEQICDTATGRAKSSVTEDALANNGFPSRMAADLFCQTNQYQSKTSAQWNAYYNQQTGGAGPGVGATGAGTAAPNINPAALTAQQQTNLGIKTDAAGNVASPFEKPKPAAPAAPATVTCPDANHTPPNAEGCCPGETLTDMGDQGKNCCPATGDCFPPIK
ncbi:MAG: hypothetical protein FWC51_01865, partial [Proteobacteria bacterium]|nr:hypothetical protein [Pseudomonadota bacterium]